MIDKFNETVRQAEKNVIDIDRDLEYLETVVAILKWRGEDSGEAEMQEWKTRGFLHRAKEILREAEINRSKFLETKVHALSALTRGGASYAAAEKAVDAIFHELDRVKDRGESDKKAIRAAMKEFKNVARETGDPCLKKIAAALESLDAPESLHS